MSFRKYCVVTGGNFGDDLNALLWDTLFPDLETLSERIWFYGIGTLLGGQHNSGGRVRVVMGSGVGGACRAQPGGGWDFRWVRGPLTAAEFKISAERALGDGAILWPELYRGEPSKSGPVGIIPHHGTWQSFDWRLVADQLASHGLDVVLINPKQSPLAIRDAIAQCSRILTESLHGGIFADAMGVAWAPCALAYRFNRFKWQDWCATIGRDFTPLVLDRPLVNELKRSVAIKHQLLRWIPHASGRENSLRPTRVASQEDIISVGKQLKGWIQNSALFVASPRSQTIAQRDRMLAACEAFASDYGIRFERPQYQHHG